MDSLIEYLSQHCYNSTLTHDEIENRIHSVHQADKERRLIVEKVAVMPKYQKKIIKK